MRLVFAGHIVHGDYRGERAVDGFRSMVDAYGFDIVEKCAFLSYDRETFAITDCAAGAPMCGRRKKH
jgi:hypothetical protein